MSKAGYGPADPCMKIHSVSMVDKCSMGLWILARGSIRLDEYQCSSQRQLQRVALSQRSKHSCGLIAFFQTTSRVWEHCSLALQLDIHVQ